MSVSKRRHACLGVIVFDVATSCCFVAPFECGVRSEGGGGGGGRGASATRIHTLRHTYNMFQPVVYIGWLPGPACNLRHPRARVDELPPPPLPPPPPSRLWPLPIWLPLTTPALQILGPCLIMLSHALFNFV